RPDSTDNRGHGSCGDAELQIFYRNGSASAGGPATISAAIPLRPVEARRIGASRTLARKRVARVQAPALETPLQPHHPLLRRAVRERLGHHTALGLPLEPVVADRCGGPQ